MYTFYSRNFSDKNQIIKRHEDAIAIKSKPLTYDILHHELRSKYDEKKFLEKISAIIVIHYSVVSPQKAEVS